MIELRNFSKSYFKTRDANNGCAVENVSFLCNAKSITGLVGENGSGKSTIIKAITAIHYPTEGKVFVSDRNGDKIDTLENPEKIKKICGYVPELPLLPGDMTVKGFLKYVAMLHGFENSKKDNPDNSEAALEKILENVIADCFLETVTEKKIKNLSKGFKQRVSLAQSLVSKPAVLVLDEPFSGLDPAQIIQMRSLILREAMDKTILISSHNLSEVHNLCSKILVMKKGHLVADGSEEEIIRKTNSKTFEEAFLKL